MTETERPPGAGGHFPHRYGAALAQAIEAKWQDFWEREETFHAPNPGERGPGERGFDPHKPKKFILDMFPYPSGVGLHVGHPLGYIATDVYARYLRMCGANVLHPMGFDAFGLPAEQYAVQTGQHPRVTTERNIATMRAQMRRLGLGHDPRRFLATTDTGFYRWTQWIFLQVFNAWYDREADRARPIVDLEREFASGKRPAAGERANPSGKAWHQLTAIERRRIIDDHRLAYLAEVPVNWCPELGTVLANEEVTADGRSERGNHPVYKRPMKQWMMRITAYCERLLRDLEPLDWPEPIQLMQRNWIGRSEGAEVDFLALDPAAAAGDDAVERWFESRRGGGWPTTLGSGDAVIRVFTTRPDTLYGATYMVLAPEHPLVEMLTAARWPSGTNEAWKGQFPGAKAAGAPPRESVAAYRAFAAARSDVERQVEVKEKTGVFLGAFAVNPVNRRRIPIFIADYVLMGYGTGAIMAVPAHDERDFAFARQFGLPIPTVVRPPDAWIDARGGPKAIEAGLPEAFTQDGIAVQSPVIDGLPTSEAKPAITRWLEERGLGRRTVNYRLRDWLFSRQRYWGEPFPIVYDESGLPVALDESMLPVELPDMDDYRPTVNDDPESPPQPPLGRAAHWARVRIGGKELGGKEYRRELNTMPNWAGSCWYYLRYLDPTNDRRLVDPEVERYWMLSAKGGAARPQRFDPRTCHLGGVDLYVGGAEHAVLHLLYSRFWHKLLFDLGHVSTPEPFGRLFNQGYVQAAAYTDKRGVYVEASDVEERDGRFFYEGEEVQREFGKMGKSLKNAVTPDEICAEYGADTLRLYEMFMGPLQDSKPWNTRDIVGVHRFLQRLWRNFVDEESGALLVSEEPASTEVRRALHRTIDGVRRDMESLSFNTAIAKLIELNNLLTASRGAAATLPREVAEPLVKMLAPLAPHAAEEIWEKLGHRRTIAYEPYPEADPALVTAQTIEVPVQVRGKVRAKIEVAPGTSAQDLERAALEHPKVQAELGGKPPKRVVVVPDRLVNVVPE